MSHHPPIAAAHCESDKYVYDIVSCPKSKFYGNSIDIFPYGINRIQCVRPFDSLRLESTRRQTPESTIAGGSLL